MNGRLQGKVAIVTGAARGIGEAAVELFLQEGAHVVATDINEPAGTAAVLNNDKGRFALHDVASYADWEKVVSFAEETFGRVDILINNAGINGAMTSIINTSEEDYRRTVDINQVGVFLGMKAVVPAMRRAGGGAIVNNSSAAGLFGQPNNFDYTATKYAVTGMTKAAACDLGEFNIRVNSVHPGLIHTPMIESVFDGAVDTAAAHYVQPLPIKRIGKPREIAEMFLFLASDASSFCTGSTFSVDGGLTSSFWVTR